MQLDYTKIDGLVAAVIQDATSGRVLMVGFMNDEAFRKTVETGYAVFYTNYGSRKAGELDATRRAAAILHWDERGRQVRFEGSVVRSPAEESDDYFASRPRRSQLNAWSSEQSRPIDDPTELERRAAVRELQGADLGGRGLQGVGRQAHGRQVAAGQTALDVDQVAVQRLPVRPEHPAHELALVAGRQRPQGLQGLWREGDGVQGQGRGQVGLVGRHRLAI